MTVKCLCINSQVYDRSGFEIGELTPGKINTTWISAAADNDIDSTLFLPEDGLRKSFTSRTGKQ